MYHDTICVLNLPHKSLVGEKPWDHCTCHSFHQGLRNMPQKVLSNIFPAHTPPCAAITSSKMRGRYVRIGSCSGTTAWWHTEISPVRQSRNRRQNNPGPVAPKSLRASARPLTLMALMTSTTGRLVLLLRTSDRVLTVIRRNQLIVLHL